MKKFYSNALLALLALGALTGCEKEPDPEPSGKVELPAPRIDETKGYGVDNSNVTYSNFEQYAKREDVHYIDLRDVATYSKQHLANFECVPFFDYILDQSADHSGVQLFYKDGTNYIPRYTDSVSQLKGLLPQDETLFLMCQSGGRVATCMQIMSDYGWDMSKVYNIGGMNQYKESKYAVNNPLANGEQLTAQTSSGEKATSSTKLVAELPDPKKDANGDYSVANSSIDSSNFDQYAKRSDVHYIDLRDQSAYDQSHLKHFECIQFFSHILDQSADHSGTQLFYKDGSTFVARYAESVQILKNLIPQNEVVFLMCQSGGRVATCMQILEQFGWDMANIYNIGGMNQYGSSKYAVNNQVAKDSTALTKYEIKAGTFTEQSFGYDYTTNVTVCVASGKIGAVIVSGSEATAAETWTNRASTWDAGKAAYLASFNGKTLADVQAMLSSEDKLVGDVKVAGATLSSRRIVKAIINALEAE